MDLVDSLILSDLSNPLSFSSSHCAEVITLTENALTGGISSEIGNLQSLGEFGYVLKMKMMNRTLIFYLQKSSIFHRT